MPAATGTGHKLQLSDIAIVCFLCWLTMAYWNSQMAARVVGRITHRLLALALETWHQHASTQRRLTGVASKGVRRMFSRTLTRALGRWKESTVELCRQRQVLKISCDDLIES